MPDVRPIDDSEVELWVEVHNAIDPQSRYTSEGIRVGREREPSRRDWLVFVERTPVGAASAVEPGDMRSSDVAWTWFGVLPEFRRRGVGTELYRAVSEHARTIGKRRLRLETWQDEHDGLEFLRRRGFEEVERFDRVRLDLTDLDPQQPELPRGIEIVTRAERPDVVQGMYDVLCEAHEDMPSAEPIEATFDDFYGWEIAHPGRRADLTFVALADGEVVGYASMTAHAEAEDAWHMMTAVKRAWRRRGIGLALKLAQIRAAKDAGFAWLGTYNEMRNEPMRLLNERLGYRPLPAQIRLHGPLEG